MAITHATVKAPGQQLFALADWNVSHVIGANTIGDTEIRSHVSTKITGFNTGSPIVFYDGIQVDDAVGSGKIYQSNLSDASVSFGLTATAGNRNVFAEFLPAGTSTGTGIFLYNTSDRSNAGYLELYTIGSVCGILVSKTGTGSTPTSFTTNIAIDLKNVVMAAPAADYMRIGSTDLSAGNTQLSWYGEGTSVGTGTPAADRTIAVRVNGTQYYLLASTSPS